MHDLINKENIGETMNKQMTVYFFLLIFGINLVGCQTGYSQQNLINSKLKELAKIEKLFERENEAIQELEMKELEEYERIISFKEKQAFKRIKTAKRAIELLNARKEKLKIESNHLHRSDLVIYELININIHTRDKGLKKKIDSLVLSRKKRIKIYDELNTLFLQAIKNERQLYKELSKEKIGSNKVKKYTRKTNTIYKKVIYLNNEYNKYTNSINRKLKNIYSITT
jgi:hypothetical protein